VNFETWFQSVQPTISLKSCEAVLRLAAEGATIPFIARYRKEQTGNLDEVGIQKVLDSKENWDKIIKRQEFIVGEIDHQKKLTPELKDKILQTFNLDQLEDLYLPYKQKRKTKATLAKEAGIEPLADWIWSCGHGTETPQPGQTLELWAFTFKNEEKGYKDAAAAIDGAQDILIERIAETQELRQQVRDQYFNHGCVKTGKGAKAKPNSKYENYFTYHEDISKLREPQNSHRYLALRRGWMEEELTLGIGAPPVQDATGAPSSDDPMVAELLKRFEAHACPIRDSVGATVLLKAARLALKAHVVPSIESEVHKALKEVADEAAIKVFAENLRKLLLASPLGPKAVIGVDPGIRTGCKLAVIDQTGKFLGSAVIHLQTESEKNNAKILLGEAVKNAEIQAIAVGNGTAGRETEVFIRGTLKDLGANIPVLMVNESGASVYSASEVAREEFPELDVTVRGAISIARRLQDPLAELVKVDPKSIGVGQYQHDVSPHSLKRSLEFVVDSCVNSVGVALNTASYHLLSHVAGIGEALAKGIVEHRTQKGLFRSREQLLEVPRFSKKAYEQAAGFLRIAGGDNPLDNTGVHPERYPLLQSLADKMKLSVGDLMGNGAQVLKKESKLREEIGPFTFDDILQELQKPGRDPREEFVAFQFREDIHEVKDLKQGMICPGIVTNVTNFGAFVDIGVHQDGLVHISQLAERFIKDPREAVSPGDRVTVRVLEINLEKNQISLSMKTGEKVQREAPASTGRPMQKGQFDRDRPRPMQRHDQRHDQRNDQRHDHRRDGRPEARHSGPPPKPVKPKEAFNNPFAALAAMKKELKAKG
jgi:uncharacterized protein